MTKSTITRKRLEQLASFKGAPVTRQEEQELARMALAAMDSESGCLPLDYLQGHKDGLEWAAQLAEANHPETGDWLYDDPIELAKAIRKGPDMPPAQPVADSEPVAVIDLANLDYLLSGADADVWPPEREEMGDVLLYRHAQPAPVVPEEATPDSIEILASARRRDHAVFQWDEDQRNAAADSWNAFRAAMLQAVNSPVIGIDQATGADRTVEVRYVAPPGYVMLPKEPTKEMIDAGWLHYMATKNPSSKGTYKAMLAAAPQEVK